MKKLSYIIKPLIFVTPRDLLLLEKLPARTHLDVLEIGIGSGSSLCRIAPLVNTLHGIDICADQVEQLRTTLKVASGDLSNVQLFTLDITKPEAHITLATQYDMVYSCDTLEHVDDPEQFFHNVYQLLKPNGSAFITYPNEHPIHAHGITYIENVETLKSMLTRSGFQEPTISIRAIKLNCYALAMLNVLWQWPRLVAKRLIKLFQGPQRRQVLPQHFNDTDFFRATKNYAQLSPIINAYGWSLLQLLSVVSPVYTTYDLPEIIWDHQILIQAKKQS